MSIHIEVGAFDLDACLSCPVQDECAAYEAVDTLHDVHYRNGHSVLAAFQDVVAWVRHSTSEADLETLEVDTQTAVTQLQAYATAAKQHHQTITSLIQRVVQAQIEPESFKASNDFKSDQIGAIAYEFRELFEQAGLGLDDNVPLEEVIDKVGSDIRYYASIGTCGAVSVEESYR